MKDSKKDNLYKKSFPESHEFKFDDNVSNVFEDMVNRSVPGYEFLINNIGVLSKKFYQPNTNVYDLGSSLCACSKSILNKVENFNGNIYAVDSSESMINICKKNIKSDNIKYVNSDICDVDIINSSIVILNLTLQFVDVKKRTNLLKKIFSQINKNGIIIVTEKISLEKASDDMFFKNFHDFFKENNGYTKEEIDRKKMALADTMEIESEVMHEKRFNLIGCNNFYKWFQCYNFVSWVLIK